VNININYKKPARYDDLLCIKTTFVSQSSVKITFECEISNEAGELLTTATFLLVFVDIKTGKPTLPPAEILAILDRVQNSEI
jgi:acyl-CoA thioester hydrolase